jgi:hypothetical protein
MALPLWLREKLFLKSLLANELKARRPLIVPCAFPTVGPQADQTGCSRQG